MASGPITSSKQMGKQWKQWQTLFLGGSKITADVDCSHESKRRLLPGRKVMTNLDSVLKGRDITLPTKVRLVKPIVFAVVTYGCESWSIKKVECWRTDAFELWHWRRPWRVPWTARRSNQSILKGNHLWIFMGRTDAEAEAPILWPPDVKSWLTGKDPDAGNDWGQKKWATDDEMIGWYHRLNGHGFEYLILCFSLREGLLPWVCVYMFSLSFPNVDIASSAVWLSSWLMPTVSIFKILPCFIRVFICLLWLCLGCWAWAFPSWGWRGLLSSCSIRASHCRGFSYCRARSPGHRLHSCGTRA